MVYSGAGILNEDLFQFFEIELLIFECYCLGIEPADKGGYVVRFPAIRGLVAEGDTLDKAHDMARDALPCFVEGQLMDGQPIPAAATASPIQGILARVVTPWLDHGVHAAAAQAAGRLAEWIPRLRAG